MFILTRVCLLVFGSAVGAVADSTIVRPTTAGVALAYPATATVRFAAKEFYSYPYELSVPVDLRISSSGVVSAVSLFHAGDSSLRPLLDSAFKLISFVPGLADRASVEQSLPVRVRIQPQFRAVMVNCPVDSSAGVGLAAEYAVALASNGISVPAISQMGSYAYPNHVQAAPRFLPSIVAKVALSKAGHPLSIDIVHSTFPGLDDQIRSVLNWASFDTSPKKSSQILTEFYTAVVFHPAAQYPTPKITGAKAGQKALSERLLFQLLPDTLGLLVPPLPRTLHCDSVAVAEAAKKLFGRVSLNVVVDTLGEISIERVSRPERPVMALVRTTVKQLDFYPALQFDGQPCQFRGLVYFDFDGSTNVRVYVDWLRDRNAEPIR